MKQFSIPLNKAFVKPVMRIDGFTALIDTGASLPVFSFKEEFLIKKYNAKKISERTNINGFGGECYGYIYQLDYLQVGQFSFKNLEVFVPETEKMRHRIILSATMFDGTEYIVDKIGKENHNFTVKIPDNMPLEREFKIKDIDGYLYAQVDGNILKDIEEDLYENDLENYTEIDF